MNFEDFKAHTNLHLLTYVGTNCCSNFKGMAFLNLKLLNVNVGKLDVCGRSLLQIRSHIHIQVVAQHGHMHGAF